MKSFFTEMLIDTPASRSNLWGLTWFNITVVNWETHPNRCRYDVTFWYKYSKDMEGIPQWWSTLTELQYSPITWEFDRYLCLSPIHNTNNAPHSQTVHFIMRHITEQPSLAVLTWYPVMIKSLQLIWGSEGAFQKHLRAHKNRSS